MTGRQRAIIAFLVLVACSLTALVASAAYGALGSFITQPLGAALPTSPHAAPSFAATWTPAAPGFAHSETTGTRANPAPAPVCGGPEVMSLLLIGSDTRGTGYTWGLADVIRIARVDFVTPAVSILDFPRDVWVEIPEISDNLNGQDHEKLNQAYLYGNPGDGFGYWDDPSAGPGLLARTLELNFGARVDHYMAVNMRTFVRMVDAVDGIDVVLNRPVSGSDNPHLQTGRHHLDGNEALAVARDRGEGVFSRGENQNVVLCALYDRLTSPSVIPRIPGLIQSFQDSVQTDLDLQTMTQLACLGTHLGTDQITFRSFPEELFSGRRVYDPVFEKSVFVWDYDSLVIRNYVARFREGGWPDAGNEDGGIAAGATYCK